MSEIFVISDTHFNHTNILKFGRDKDFQSVEEMNEVMIERWNSVVKPNDKVYHLGDFAMGPRTEHYKFITALNGKKRLVVGNHDDVKHLAPYFQKVVMWRMFGEWGLLLTHVPVHPTTLGEGRFNGKQIKNIHGHIHANPSPAGPYQCVCVEQIDYTPVNIEDLKWKIGELK